VKTTDASAVAVAAQAGEWEKEMVEGDAGYTRGNEMACPPADDGVEKDSDAPRGGILPDKRVRVACCVSGTWLKLRDFSIDHILNNMLIRLTDYH
jgi:hypothetical protein